MTREDITIIMPNQLDLERMAEDGADIVHSDTSLMREITQGVTSGVAARIRAYEAQPPVELEGEIL
jgi:hypothetical protein